MLLILSMLSRLWHFEVDSMVIRYRGTKSIRLLQINIYFLREAGIKKDLVFAGFCYRVEVGVEVYKTIESNRIVISY